MLFKMFIIPLGNDSSHEPCSFRILQTAELSERYRERNREAEQKKKKKENRRKGSDIAPPRRGASRVFS